MANYHDLQVQPLFENIDSQNFSFLTQQLCLAPGYNRSDKPNLLEASNDAQAIQTFLSDYRDTKLTYRSYLKEIERLVLWATHVPKLTISNLKREHFVAYREFLEDPQPTPVWCGPRAPRFLDVNQPNPAWRAFASPLSKPTIRKTISILDSFFNYLVKNNYLAGNPLAVDRRRKGIKSRGTERWLERDEISTVLDALSLQPQKTPEQSFLILRARYIILTLFYTGLRLAELTSHRMGNFCLIEDEWYIKVVGKGEKERNIVVVDEYLDVLAAFRKALGMRTHLPEYQEATPLVPAQNLRDALTPSRVWQILKWSFELGAQHYQSLPSSSEEEALKNDHKASKLRKASTHWLRHSYGTYLVKSGCPIEKVKELMGHSDIGTTMIYVHIAKNDLHESARGLSLVDIS